MSSKPGGGQNPPVDTEQATDAYSRPNPPDAARDADPHDRPQDTAASLLDDDIPYGGGPDAPEVEEEPTVRVGPDGEPEAVLVEEADDGGTKRLVMLCIIAFAIAFGGTAFTLFQAQFLYNGYKHGGVF